MKKYRGLRRYYKNLAIQNDFEKTGYFEYFKNPNAWFYHKHWHFDLNGFGNHSFKRRKPHLDKLFRHFEMLVEGVKSLKVEFQLFAVILDNHSASDALFLHSPNPNGSEFPLTWEELSETCTLKNKDLIDYLNQQNEYEKLYGIAEESFCVLFKKNIGIQTFMQIKRDGSAQQAVWRKRGRGSPESLCGFGSFAPVRAAVEAPPAPSRRDVTCNPGEADREAIDGSLNSH
jgi:hypothetical protein